VGPPTNPGGGGGAGAGAGGGGGPPPTHKGGGGGGFNANRGNLVYTGDRATVIAGDGDNTIISKGGLNTITTGTGNDVIYCLCGPNMGLNTVFLGNGHNWVFLSGSGNTVFDGTGTDEIWAGTGNDYFQLNAGGGSDLISNFTVTDKLDLSQVLAGLGLSATQQDLAPHVTVATQTTGGACPTTNTLITVLGPGAAATVTLEHYNAGGLAGLLANNNLVV